MTGFTDPSLIWITLPDSYRKAGFGGVDRFTQLAGYANSDLLINFRTRIEEIKSKAKIQSESFNSIEEKTNEWRREMDHMPLISPVDVKYRLGDGFKFREVHPILGNARECIMVRISRFLMVPMFMPQVMAR